MHYKYCIAAAAGPAAGPLAGRSDRFFSLLATGKIPRRPASPS